MASTGGASGHLAAAALTNLQRLVANRLILTEYGCCHLTGIASYITRRSFAAGFDCARQRGVTLGKKILVLLKVKEEVHSGILSFQVLVEDSPPKINIGFG